MSRTAQIHRRHVSIGGHVQDEAAATKGIRRADDWCCKGQRPSASWHRLMAMSTEKDSGSLASVKPGDVLVSRPSAMREHEISIVPNASHATSPTHDAAVRDGGSEADALGVDAWLTEDQTHVVKIASPCSPDKRVQDALFKRGR
jgi:hypothetical protein